MATNATKTSLQDREHNKFDVLTNASVTITEPHHLCHLGLIFHMSHKHTGILAAGTEDILIRVPAGDYPHLHRVRISLGAGDIDIVLYEGSTVSATGAAISTHNTNRNSLLTSKLTAYDGPTITDLGEEIHRQWVPPTGTGIGMSDIGFANAEAGEEWILTPDTDYTIRITNNSADTIDLLLEALWYELRYKEL